MRKSIHSAGTWDGPNANPSSSFHIFFHQLDNFKTDYFLWVTAGGLEAAYERSNRSGEKIPKALEAELGDEADGVAEEAN
jgi:tRNA pseudouridine38-40 synthase